MKIFYDTEFLDTGRTIEPISLGMVREDGTELYCVFENIMNTPLYGQITRNYWLMDNVVRRLPLVADMAKFKLPDTRFAGRYALDRSNPVVKSKIAIRAEVRRFLSDSAPVELWAYYAAYDHVLLAQLFGRWVDDRPRALPMRTRDVAELCENLGRSEAGLPAEPWNAHNALVDARWARDCHRSLIERPGPAWTV